MAFEIGKEIAALRKAAGMTQEDLGRAVGVSTQAVSRWECGGTPDITLLPILADRLGVSVDRLFGRDREFQDAAASAVSYYNALPEQARYNWLCKLVWQCAVTAITNSFYGDDLPSGYTSHFMVQDVWVRSEIAEDSGFVIGACAEPLHFLVTAEEPEAGFGSYLLRPEAYRALFRVLSLPHSMEILLHLHSRKTMLTLPQTVAKQLGLELKPTQDAMEAMHKQNLLTAQELELEDGLAKAYRPHDGAGMTMFLLFARWITEGEYWFYNFNDRSTPFLRKDEKVYEESQPKSR